MGSVMYADTNSAHAAALKALTRRQCAQGRHIATCAHRNGK